MKKLSQLLFSIWLYAGWFLCVWMAKNNLNEFTPLSALVGWAFFWVGFNPKVKQVAHIFLVCGIGLFFDAACLHWHLIQIEPGPGFGWVPLWLVSLWFVFVPAFPLFQRLFGRRYLIAALAGAVMGPLSYRSGGALGVLHFSSTNVILIYSLFWAVFFPFGIYFTTDMADLNSQKFAN